MSLIFNCSQLFSQVRFFRSQRLSYFLHFSDVIQQRRDLAFLQHDGFFSRRAFGLCLRQHGTQAHHFVSQRRDAHLHLAALCGHGLGLANGLAQLAHQLSVSHQDNDQRHQKDEHHHRHDVGKRRPHAVLVRAPTHRGRDSQVDKTVCAGNSHCLLPVGIVQPESLSQYLGHLDQTLAVALHFVAVTCKQAAHILGYLCISRLRFV